MSLCWRYHVSIKFVFLPLRFVPRRTLLVPLKDSKGILIWRGKKIALVVLLCRSFDMIDLVVLPLPGPACLNEDARMLRNNMSLKRPMSNAPRGAAASK